jgi:hypothetical protein
VIPHAWPFRFVEATSSVTGPSSGRVRAAVTANGRRTEGGAALAPLTLAEMIAQSALLLTGDGPEVGKGGFLAGISDFTVEKTPRAGDRLEVDVKLAAHLGPVVKFEGIIRDDAGVTVARGSVTVRRGD